MYGLNTATGPREHKPRLITQRGKKKKERKGKIEVNEQNLVTAPIERPHKPIKETFPSCRK
jgi:hypothetical protein